jgi:hypothetical protein
MCAAMAGPALLMKEEAQKIAAKASMLLKQRARSAI